MCFVLYAASSVPLPAIAWNEHAPGLSVRPIEGPAQFDRSLREKFRFSNLAEIGSSSSCACNFRRTGDVGLEALGEDGRLPTTSNLTGSDHDDENENAWLANYLRPHLEAGTQVELYGCWSGDETEPAETKIERVTLDEIEHCFLAERVLLRLTN